jgi:hypothetical protein
MDAGIRRRRSKWRPSLIFAGTIQCDKGKFPDELLVPFGGIVGDKYEAFAFLHSHLLMSELEGTNEYEKTAFR